MARKPPFLVQLLTACQVHGEQSEPDMEVGDLQGIVRDLWNALTPAQRQAFAGRADYRDLIAAWTPWGANA